jgi:predicted aspartyl protease
MKPLRTFLLSPIVIAALCGAGRALGQAAGAAPPAATPAASTLQFGVELGRMTVPVSIDGHGPFAFVVDTGAERSVVSQELAEMLRLSSGPDARLFDFTGASTVDTVQVPALSVSALGARTMDAPSLAMKNVGAPGLLGIDALQGHKVAIDFAHKRMTLTPAKHHPSGQILVNAKIQAGQLIVTDAWFGGQPIAVIIDTGSWISVGNSAMLALARRPPRPVGPISVTAVTGRSFNAEYVAIDHLKIGGVNFDNFALAFADVPPFARFGLQGKPALILGMSSLKLFQRVEIDFANQEIAFTLPRPPLDFSSICQGISACDQIYR